MGTRVAVASAVLALTASVAACSSSRAPGANPSSGVSGSASGSSSASVSSSGSASGSASSSPAAASLTVPAAIVRSASAVAAFVPVTVHGTKYAFLVDSGATVTVLDTDAAKTIGLEGLGKGPTARTIGCTVHTTITRLDRWSLGGRALPTAKVATQHLGFGAKKVDGMRVVGLLGSDFQASVGAITIDYGRHTVTFGAAPSGGTTVKVVPEPVGAVVVAAVKIKGTTVAMQVDTGATDTAVATSLAARLKLPSIGRPVRQNAAGCPVSAQPVRLSDAQLGSRRLPTATISSTRTASVHGASIAGLLGSDLLSTFGRVTIDYKDSALILGR